MVNDTTANLKRGERTFAWVIFYQMFGMMHMCINIILTSLNSWKLLLALVPILASTPWLR